MTSSGPLNPARFIPAGAGNTLAAKLIPSARPVYPRWRGEHDAQALACWAVSGLSPLARGTLVNVHEPGFIGRFIPAGAGNTHRCRSSSNPPPVYPRWRGEHAKHLDVNQVLLGLSPLARGTHVYRANLNTGERFIPAGAGNTERWRVPFPRISVYPRWRGEHLPHHIGADREGGLSPLARGTRNGYSGEFRRHRFIPAGAGNTSPSIQLAAAMTVYPRWRGEHLSMALYESVSAGLSPLARGTRPASRRPVHPKRFIPAGAGNTVSGEYNHWPFTVYPRWRGEHRCSGMSLAASAGLSPLARGTHYEVQVMFISTMPACGVPSRCCVSMVKSACRITPES